MKKMTKVSRKKSSNLTHTLYSYVTPENGKYFRSMAKQKKTSYSAAVNAALTFARSKGFSFSYEAN